MNSSPKIRFIIPAAAAILLTFGRDDWLAFLPLHTWLDLTMNLFVVVIASMFALKDITYLLSHNFLLRLLFLMLALWVAIIVIVGSPYNNWPSGTSFLTLILIILIVSQISRFELRRLRHFVLVLVGVFTIYTLIFAKNIIQMLLSGNKTFRLGEKISPSFLVAYPRIMYVIIIICLFSLIVEKGFWIRIYSAIMVILPILIAFATGGRGPLVGFILAAFVIVLGLAKKHKMYYTIVLGVLITIGYLIISNYFPVMENRIMNGDDSGRNVIWKEVLNSSTTWFGRGIFEEYPHNIFLEFLLFYGIFGLILFLIFFVTLTVSLIRCYLITRHIEVLWVISLLVLQMTAQQFSLDIFNSGLWAAIMLPLGFSWDYSAVSDTGFETFPEIGKKSKKAWFKRKNQFHHAYLRDGRS
jgi:O-antigen ligase